MIAVTRLRMPAGAEPEREPELRERFRDAIDALAAQAGCRSVTAARSIDEPDLWVLTSVWASVGAYRRALSAYQVKLRAVPLLYHAVDEPSAFEELLGWTPQAGLTESGSDLAVDDPA